MASTLTIPLVTLPVGARDFGPAAAADAETKIVLTIDRTAAGGLNSLTPASTVAVTVYQSGDGGATWQLNVGGTFPGGFVQIDRQGDPATVSALRVDLAPGTSRMLKATAVVAGTPVAVAGTLVTT